MKSGLTAIALLMIFLLTWSSLRSSAQAGWTQPTVMPGARAGFGAAVGPDGRIYLVGGQISPDHYDVVSPVDIYDPAKNIWTKGAPMLTSRVGLVVATGPDGLIYAIGGFDSSGKVVATVEAYNTLTDTWSKVTPLPEPRYYETSSGAAVGSDGLLYSIGGRTLGNTPTDTVLAYDVNAKKWTSRMPAPYVGDPIAITAGPDGKIYAAFGVSGLFAAYDPVANAWTTLPQLPNPRNQSAVVAGLDGLIYVIGGRYYYSVSFSEVDVYDPVTSRWSTAPALPKSSYYLPVVSISDGRLFAFATDEETGYASSFKARVDTYHVAPTNLVTDHGGNGGNVTVDITLKGAREGASVKLVADKLPDIIGTNTITRVFTNFKNASRIQTTFDLTGAPLGPRNVVITNPDGTVITLPQQFTVEDLKEPLLKTQVIGRSQIRGGAWTTYNVLVQNTGNVDANASDLRIEFPKYFEWQLLEAKANDIFTGENSAAIGVQTDAIPAGGSRVLSLRVKSPDDPRYAHAMFEVQAWVNVDFSPAIVFIGDLTEKHFLRTKDTEGTVSDYFGIIGSTGFVERLDYLQVTQKGNGISNGFSSTESFDDHGRPSKITGSNGYSIAFVYPRTESTQVQVILLSPTGEHLVSILADFIAQQTTPLLAYTGCKSAVLLCRAQTALLDLACQYSDFTNAAVSTVCGAFTPGPLPVKLAVSFMCSYAVNKLIPAACKTLPALHKSCDNLDMTCDQIITSGDPNDIEGSVGFDAPHWLSGFQPLPYTVFFANIQEATAAAQVVRVIDQLDLPGVDLRTLSLSTITVGNQTLTPESHINPIEGVREYNAEADLRPAKNLLVGINAKLNLDNGMLQWTFTSLDPLTHLPLDPADPNGFLDPGQEGSVLFTVMPRKNLKTGTVVQNQASIKFDFNASMDTNVWFNTIDNDKPSSQVNKLAGTQNDLSFPVSWQGQDVGSGLRDYTIYVSDNGGAFTPWLSNTTSTKAIFTGVAGHTYAFYSTARDNVFNLENAHVLPDTMTTIAKSVATDVTSKVNIKRSGFRLNKTTNRFVQTVTLTNTSGAAITGAVSLTLDSLSANAMLFGKSGVTSATTPSGSPYLDVQTGDLAAGATVTVTLEFTNSDNSKGITYTARVLAGPGSR